MTNIELSSYGSISSEERNGDNDDRTEEAAIAMGSSAEASLPQSSRVAARARAWTGRNDGHDVRTLLIRLALPSTICIGVGILYLASSHTGDYSVGYGGRTAVFPWTSPWRVGPDRIDAAAGRDASNALGYLQSLADAATAAYADYQQSPSSASPPSTPGRHQHRGKKKGQEQAVPPPPPTLRNRPHNATEQPLLPPRGCESTVMIVRHCEKDVLEENCDYVGFERAEYLKHLFGANVGRPGPTAAAGAAGGGGGGYVPRWPAPSYMFALSAQRHSNHHRNYREIQTIQPLADKFHLPIDSNYSVSHTNDLSHLIFDRLHAGKTCGRLTVISWKHSEIPTLAKSLGCGPLQGCPMDYPAAEFDAVYQIKFVYDGTSRGGLPRDPMPVEQRSSGGGGTAARQRQQKQRPQKGNPTWKVFGSVQHQGFDPLEFSTRAGDYPEGGAKTGGRWIESSLRVEDIEV